MKERCMQKNLFVDGDIPDKIILSPILKEILTLFYAFPKKKGQAIRNFNKYTYKIVKKNSSVYVNELIAFAKSFRETRGSGRLYMERLIFGAFKAIIGNICLVLKRPEKSKIVIKKNINTIKDIDIKNALSIVISVTDFIENTLDYVPLKRDTLNGERKAMAVELIPDLLYSVEYPRLYQLIEKALLCGYKAAVLSAIKFIYYCEIQGDGIIKVLETVKQNSKDFDIINHVDLLLAEIKGELVDIFLFENKDDDID